MAQPDKLSVNRRQLLQASAAGAAAVAASATLPATAAYAVPEAETATAPAALNPASPDPGPGGTAPVRPFQLGDVRLGDGLLQEKRDRMKNFLRQYDQRRFLVLFNNEAGRPNPPGVAVPGGWEDGGLLSGHWAGHFMTALAQAYADQREPIFKTKLDWMVDELAACQDAITARMGGGSGGDPEEPPQPEIGRVPGKFGNGLRLNGPSAAQYVTLPQEAISQLSDFTFATWVNLASTQNWSRLFDFGQNTTVNMFLTPRAGAAGNVPRFAITVSGSGGEQQINGNAALPTNQWVHLAVTLSRNTGTLYVNGEEAGRNSNMTLNPSNLGNPGNRWIGRSQYGDPMLDATIDEFHVFDRALSQQEVRSLLDSPAGSTGGGTIGWYRFDEDGGTVLKDASPNGRDAGVVVKQDGGKLWVPTHPGYLGALPEDTVLRLGPPRWAVYGGNKETNTWAPWYTQHKIMRGLLDACYHTGNQKALDVVVKMANWAHLALTIGDKNHPNYTGPITRDNLNYMWDLYIAGESGGANEVFPEIYQLTGDAKHLETAKCFDNRESLFQACVENRDILVTTPQTRPGRRRPDRLHVNQHVPQFVGYLRVYEHSADPEYFQAAKNFFKMIVPHRMYVSGGTGGNFPGSNNNIEMFQNRDNVANSIAQGGAETCSAYNLGKLARNLFLHEHDPAYMDYYERVLLNQIAGSRADSASVSNPQVTYFQPLTPGANRSYGNTGTCCGGTGLENHTKYQETIYFKSADGSALWVNLFVPSTLTWAEKGFTVTQETSYPRSDRTKLVVNGSGPLDLKVRVPAWVEKGFFVSVNGAPVEVDAQPGSYLTLSRTWAPGDTVEIRMPFSIRIERALDRPDTQAIFWGPVVLQILGNPGGGSYRELSLYRHLKRDGDYARSAITHAGTTPAGDMLFTTHGFNLRPYYISDSQAVSSYFRRVEPTIVFGSIDTGVPNRKRNDGLPNYDVPVAGIPSPGNDGPTFLDLVWDEAPFANHGSFVSAVAQTAEAFVAAGVFSDAEKDLVVSTAARASKELAP